MKTLFQLPPWRVPACPTQPAEEAEGAVEEGEGVQEGVQGSACQSRGEGKEETNWEAGEKGTEGELSNIVTTRPS